MPMTLSIGRLLTVADNKKTKNGKLFIMQDKFPKMRIFMIRQMSRRMTRLKILLIKELKDLTHN